MRQPLAQISLASSLVPSSFLLHIESAFDLSIPTSTPPHISRYTIGHKLLQASLAVNVNP